MLDYKMLREGITPLSDFQKAEDEFQLKKQLLQAQAESERKKLTQVDVDKLGEQAFMKAAMGAPLTMEEQAAAMFLDAKSGGTSFNPVTGEAFQKPRISDKIGLTGIGGNVQPQQKITQTNMAVNPPSLSQSQDLPNVFDGLPVEGSETQFQDPYEAAYKENLAASRGNPKLQQQITADYMKNKADAQIKLREQQDQFNRGTQVKQAALDAVNRLLKNPSLESVTGPFDQRTPTFFNRSADAEADIEYVRNLMTTENLGLLKGVLSDTDMKILASIGSGELSGSDERVLSALKKMKKSLSAQVNAASPYVRQYPVQTPILSGAGKGDSQIINWEDLP